MRLYNSMTGKKEEFVPITEGEVKMYVCGPTVYNFFHIGNARPFLIFDGFRRYLEYRGYKVTYVQNFTDVDDKIINRSLEEKISSSEVSEKYIGEYFKDATSLGIKPATVHPKVTENINEIIDFISKLVAKGYAYEKNGDVYYKTHSFSDYGKLSKQRIEDLEMGARVEVNTNKLSPVDFALWKAAKPGEPSWKSPWGLGRPGWHIECSVMSTKYLGETIDIHAGGQDLIFPHHENEIAQSEAYSGKPFANYWMHNGYININNEKMSKSKGNFFTVREILDEYEGEVIRFFLLSAHYRNPVNFSRELIEQAENGLNRIYKAKENLEYYLENAKENEENIDKFQDKLNEYRKKFVEVMDDDFNTADGISVIFELVKFVNVEISEESSKEKITLGYQLLKELCDVLGILSKNKEMIDEEIEELIEKRQQARKDKDYSLADKIRDELKEKGIILEDTSGGVKWKKIK